MNKSLHFLGSLALVTSLAACAPVASTTGDFPNTGNGGNGGNNNGASPDGGDPGTPGAPSTTPTNPLNNGATYSGVYKANAALDFTQPGVLPGLLSPALAALANLSTDPGSSLVNFAQAAGAINLNSTTRNVIASVITDKLASVLPPDVKQALDLISNITQITSSTTLLNTITVHTPSTTGAVYVDVIVTGAGFDFVDVNGTATHVDVQTSAAQLPASKSTILGKLTPHSNAPIADADVTFTGGSISIPVGDFLVQALGTLVFQPLGQTDLKSTLLHLMSNTCDDLGYVVETGVYNLTSLDVGHDVGTRICTTAITLAANEITSAISSLKVNNVKITNGRFTLFDVSPSHSAVDHKADLLGDGSWTWSFGSANIDTSIDDGTRSASAI